MIYLDNAATTRVFDNAARAASFSMTDDYFNPNSTYKCAVSVNNEIERARRTIAAAVGARADELIFTSCATEANNTVFLCGIKNRKGNIVISAGEHSSVYECARLLKNRGSDIRIAPLTNGGAVDVDELINLVDADTALVSVIHVSNETGVVNPIGEIAGAVRKKNKSALIHSDGVQGAVKLGEPIDRLGVDYYSISAHKLGAPKGIGLLYIRDGLNIAPLLCGGGQERGLRSGTQNTPYISAFSSAIAEFKQRANREKTIALRDELCECFSSNGCKIVGSDENSGYILCTCVPGVKAEILQNSVYDRGVIIGKGSACSGSSRGNRVLGAMGLSSVEIESCIRISLFCDTLRDDALAAAEIILDAAKTIRSRNGK